MAFVNGKPSTSEPWNKGKKGSQVPWNKGLKKTEDIRIAKFSENLKGHPNFNVELKGCYKKGRISERKGTGKARYWNQQKYIDLRTEMFLENDYTCLACGKRGGKIELHHILPVSLFPEFIYNKDNVVVLCRKCHTLTDTYGLSLVRKRGELRENLSKTTPSQAKEETLRKVQRLIAEASVNDHASNCYHERPARKGRDSLSLQVTVRSAG
jgi:5-methylcytosine-specific restriction endonuclease McrA